MNKSGVLAITLVIIGSIIFVWGYIQPKKSIDGPKQEITLLDTIPTATIEYGLCLDSFIVHKNVIEPNQFLANILLQHHVPYPEIDFLAKQSVEIFDVKKIASGKNYTVLCKKDSIEKAQYFIYEPNAIDYIVYDMA